MLTTTQWVVLLAGLAIVVLAAIVLISRSSSRRRHVELKQRFGPEYDRALERHGDVTSAERELAARERRMQKQPLRPLAENDRQRFSAEWRGVQARFVDEPSGAVQAANALIKAVMNARGYPEERFEQRVADLSVDHAEVVQHYRAARGLAEADREGRASTEDLRQAFVHYRALFADLLEQPERTGHQRVEEVRV